MMQATNWLPGLLVLGAGLASGLALLLFSRRRSERGDAVVPRDPTRANLEQRAELLLEQLKELAADRHLLGEERYAMEKVRLERAAAAALQDRDEHVVTRGRDPLTAPPSTPLGLNGAPTQGFLAQHPQLKGALWGGGVVLFFVTLGLVLSREEKPRAEGAELTGKSPPMKSAPSRPAADETEEKDLGEAIAQVNEHPEDLETAARVAHELIRLQRFDEAQRITEQSLGFDAFHIEHRIHRAVLETTRGQSTQALAELEHLAKSYPHAEEARLFLGGLRMETGNLKGALESFERFAAEAAPDDQPPQLGHVIEELRAQLTKASP